MIFSTLILKKYNYFKKAFIFLLLNFFWSCNNVFESEMMMPQSDDDATKRNDDATR
jgi:hypothetical protein